MMPPYAVLHRLSVEDGYGNTPHVLCQEAPCTEYETRYYGTQSVCPFYALVRLGMHLDTPGKIEHTFDRLYEVLILHDAVHWHLRWDDGCRVYYGPLLWHSVERPYSTGDMRLEIGLLSPVLHAPVTTKRRLKEHVRKHMTSRS